MKLFIDTETTGLLRKDLPLTDARQPWPVEIACVLEDDAGEISSEYHAVIRPKGWTIPGEAQKLHGISTDYALKAGMSLASALATLAGFLGSASRVVVFNADFDLALIESAELRLGLRPCIRSKPSTCAMRLYADHYGGGWPKLSEAYDEATGGAEFPAPHTALGDARAARIVYNFLCVARA